MAEIRTTGNSRVDTATAEIAVALRDARPGQRDQAYYDEAARLRDEILSWAGLAGECGQSAVAIEQSLAEALHEEWPHTFNDGYQAVVAQVAVEHVLAVIRDRVARDTAQGLMNRLIEVGCHDNDWNGGDVVEVVDAWLKEQGVDTHAAICGFCGDSVAMTGFVAHWYGHQAGMDAEDLVECPLCGEPLQVGEVREHYRTEHPEDDPAADGLENESGG